MPDINIYPEEYKRKPKSVKNQIIELLSHFPELNPEPTLKFERDELAAILSSLPDWVEGPFVTPNEYKLAEKFYPKIQEQTEKYPAGVKLLLDKMGSKRLVHQDNREIINPKNLQRCDRTREMIDRLIEKQHNADFIIHFAHLGARFYEHSINQAKNNLQAQEYGVGLFEITSFLLTHPQRLNRYLGPSMDAFGDKLRDNHFYVPGLRWCAKGIKLYARSIWIMERNYEPVSAYLPEYPPLPHKEQEHATV